jgi:hypothetical protein
MFNLSSKKHYLTNTMKGFQNYFNTRIYSVESYHNEPETLYIHLFVNPTTEKYTDVERIETTVKYNLVKDTFTIKAEGKGSKKYSRNIKYDVTDIINSLVQEANNYYKGDCTDALYITSTHCHTLLKEAGATTAELNQIHFDINHTYSTVKEIEIAFNAIMVTLQPTQEELTNTNSTQSTTYEVGNRTFSTHAEALQYCNESDFDPDTMLKEVATEQPSHVTNEPIQYYFYKQLFDTYNEAYNYALSNLSPVTMVLPSNHPTMTNERLIRLEKEYTFSKHHMTYTDMKEYFAYISTLPVSTDQQERYYKLTSYIERYDYKQKSIQASENERQRLSLEGSRLLVFMKEKGLQLHLKESYQYYTLNGEHVYTFHSCSVEKYYNDMLQLFNKYFSHYSDEYNQTKVYFYKAQNDTTLSMEDHPIGWISYNHSTHIAVFNRPLNDAEVSYYKLSVLEVEKEIQAVTSN